MSNAMATTENATIENAAGNTRKLACRYCQNTYSKAEHLTRHERSHTGLRPFTCKVCKRSFSRQDSLARHEKLHLRRDSSKHGMSPTAGVSMAASPTLLTPDSMGDVQQAGIGASKPTTGQTNQSWPPRQATQEGGLLELSQTVDLDFQLIWPDSEDLFHTIMSSDSTSQWQMPLGTLPFPPQLDQVTPMSFGSPSSFDERGSSFGSIPTGRGHQAVTGVSKMIASLSSSVTADIEATSITSVYLDECLNFFFERFIPTFPVLHRATFVFKECTHPLLLNAIAIGSLYLGPKDAIAKGEALWRLSHTAVATTWQTLIEHQGPYDACKGLQLVLTAILGQVYAALSRNRALRTTSQIFHALGFFWARHCGMYDSEPFRNSDLPALDAPQAEKEHQWKIWSSREIQKRALLAHYILDGQIAQMSGDPTSTRHAANQLGLPSNDAAFEASNADAWLFHMRSDPIPGISFRGIFRSLFSPTGVPRPYENSLSSFSLRVILEGLQSLISDCDDLDGAAVGVPTRSEVRRALAQIHESITSNTTLSAPDRLETLLRWHGICLDAATDSSLLCRHICARHNIIQHVLGGGKGIKSGLDLVAWARTEDARRALLHAVAIQDIVEQLPRGRAHVIHMPGALFAAATVYSVFSMAGFTTVHLPRTVDWKDALFTEVDPCVILGQLSGSAASSDTRRFVRGEQTNGGSFTTTRNLLYELNSMQKLFRCLSSQWGVAFDMERILDQWISLSH